MNFKKKVSGSWVDAPHYLRGTDTDTITSLPTTIYGDGTAATLSIKGNTTQSGTPSPSNPVDVVGCGDMSSNILSVYKENYSISATGEETYNTVAMIYKAEVAVADSTFVLNFGGLSSGDVVRIHAYTGDTWQQQIAAITITQVPFTFTLASNIDNIRVSIRKTATDVTMTDGQYKIPILNGSVTTNIYLGEVQTVRNVKKRVLTGTEAVSKYAYGGQNGFIVTALERNYFRRQGICTHYPVSTSSAVSALIIGVSDKNLYFGGIGDVLGITEPEDFKTWLSQQYANGTPVIVYYAAQAESTDIVNEPLMKIGNYADTLSTSIATTDGANTLSIGTTVQPSEVTANYHGWHPIQSVHEAENGQWD